jgi:diguanylate cyclase (GGDEF)-like protein
MIAHKQVSFFNKIIFGTEDLSVLPKLQPALDKSNKKSLSTASGFFGVLMLAMTIIAVFLKTFRHNIVLYSISFLICLATFILTRISTVYSRRLVTPLFYLFIIDAFAFGIILSNFYTTLSAAVTFNVLLVAFPFLLCDVPWKMNVVLVLSYTVFEVTSYWQKSPEIFTYDITNGTSFVFVAVFINTYQQIRRMQDFYNGLIVKKQRDTDALTGTFTKKALEISIRKCISEPDASGSLMIVDIDNFKSVNDKFGHAIGDYFIAATARSLLSVCRSTDIVGRFGGDEFVMLFHGLDSISQIEMKVQEIKKAVKENVSKGFAREEITMCIGCTIFPRNGTKYEDLFDQMDNALYQAKNSGKNKYVIFK